MRVVFRVDSSLEIGSGHVMRCLTLADALREKGASVQFICRNHAGNLIKNIQDKGYTVFAFDINETYEFKSGGNIFYEHWLGDTQSNDAKDCYELLQNIQPDWLIVDHYAINARWQTTLKGVYKKLMVIDDLGDRNHVCDLLLDQTFGRQEQDYTNLVPNYCELLLGSQYALLRPEFAKWRQYSLARRKEPEFKQLLINMGGVDVDNVTEQVLQELGVCNLPHNLKIIVVMGGSAPHLESVQTKVDALPYRAEVRINVENMAEIMANSDMAIGAAGATSWERCCLGLPAIQIVIAKNQDIIAKLLANKNAVKLLQDLGQLNNLMESATSWMSNISSIAKQISDGYGAIRVTNKMIGKEI